MSRRRIGLASSRSCSPAFTIVELLVVTATLAILAAIIFPLLSRVRQTAYRVQCAANLRQLGQAFSLYANDWHGYWPSPGGLVGNRGYWSQSGSGGLYRYVRQRGLDSVWCCPLLKEWHGKYPARSYSMNSFLRTPPDIEYPKVVEYPFCLGYLRGINIGNIPEPSRTILLFEGVPITNGLEDKLDYLYRCANWTRVRGYWHKWAYTIDPGTPWHGELNNYLFADGHIVARRPGKKTKGVLSTYAEMSQWYVDKARFHRKFSKYRP